VLARGNSKSLRRSRGIQQLADCSAAARRPGRGQVRKIILDVSACRSGPGSANCRQGLSASATWVISTISVWPVRCAAWKWAFSSPAFRSAREGVAAALGYLASPGGEAAAAQVRVRLA
jgi:hypothetical protein